MSKLLEILNKSFIEIHTKFGAEFLDIKGEGGIAIYSTENYLTAFLAAKTINTYYQRFVFKEINKKDMILNL